MNWKKALGIILGIGLILILVWGLLPNNSQADQVFPVETAVVETQDLQETVNVTGLVEPVESQEIYNQGYVTQVNVALEDQVSQGDSLAEYLETGEVEANIDGTVTQLNISEGEVDANLQLGQPSIVISTLYELQVSAQLSKSEAERVQVDQDVSLSYNDQEFTGQVQEIAPVATESQGAGLQIPGESSASLDILINLPDDVEGLIPGFDIDGEIIVSRVADEPVVPIQALTYDSEGNTAVFLVEDGQAILRDVSLGITEGTMVQVLEGLNVGDTVILSPSEELEDQSLVEPASPDQEEAQE